MKPLLYEYNTGVRYVLLADARGFVSKLLKIDRR